MIRVAVLGLLLFGVWLLWSGHYTPFLLELGAASCLLILLLLHRMNILDDEGQPIHLVWRLPFYLPYLFKEIVLANIDVAKRILNPSLPISPTLFVVKAGQRTELAQVIYANSITLTPGTVTVRLRDGYLVIHSLARDAEDALRSGEMDRAVQKLEGPFT